MNTKTHQKLHKRIFDQIKKSKKIAILVSEPDQDSIGSGLALKEILSQFMKKSILYSSFPIDTFRYLPHIKQYTVTDIARIHLKLYDTIFVLDASEVYRLVDVKKYPSGIALPKTSFIINIDHHQNNSRFGDINYIFKSIRSSTAEALYEIFKNTISITPTIATNLLAGMIEDTGCLRHAFSSRTLRILADLIDSEGEYNMLVNKIYYSNSSKIVKANVKSLNSLKEKRVGKYSYAFVIVKPDEFGVAQPRRNEVRILQETLKSLSDVDFSMRITPISRKLTDISFRSRDVKVSDIAEFFGGGGHDRAAGSTVKMNINNFLKNLNLYLKKNKLHKVRYL